VCFSAFLGRNSPLAKSLSERRISKKIEESEITIIRPNLFRKSCGFCYKKWN
jgi:hypothetical protein